MKNFLFFLFTLNLLTACGHAPLGDTRGEMTDTPTTEIKNTDVVEERAKNLRELGLSSYQRNDFPRAIQQLEGAFLMAPQAQETRSKFILYYCYLATGDYKKALTVAEYLVKAHPYQSLSYQQVGLAQLWLGHSALAANSFLRALEFDSHSPKVHFYLGLAQSAMKSENSKEKSFREAEKEFQEILTKNPKDFQANYELASLYLYWNRSLEKVAVLLESARKNFANPTPKFSEPPDFSEDAVGDNRVFTHYYIPLLEGILLYKNGDGPNALKTLFEAFPYVPSGSKADLAELYFYLGQSQRLTGNKENAKIFLEQSISTDPKGPYCEESKRTIKALGAG